MVGWFKLQRSHILEADGLFNRLSVFHQALVLQILMRANFKDAIWSDAYRGIDVPIQRGELITSREKIKGWFPCGQVSDQQIRSALSRLERMGFLTIKTTKCYTRLKVLQYEELQGLEIENNQLSNQALTIPQPIDRQAFTTNKEEHIKTNNNEEEAENFIFSDCLEGRVLRYFYDKLLEAGRSKASFNQAWIDKGTKDIETFVNQHAISEDELKAAIDFFLNSEFWKQKLYTAQQIIKYWYQFESNKATAGNAQAKISRWDRLLKTEKLINRYNLSTILLTDYDFDLKGYGNTRPGLIPKGGGQALDASEFDPYKESPDS